MKGGLVTRNEVTRRENRDGANVNRRVGVFAAATVAAAPVAGLANCGEDSGGPRISPGSSTVQGDGGSPVQTPDASTPVQTPDAGTPVVVTPDASTPAETVCRAVVRGYKYTVVTSAGRRETHVDGDVVDGYTVATGRIAGDGTVEYLSPVNNDGSANPEAHFMLVSPDGRTVVDLETGRAVNPQGETVRVADVGVRTQYVDKTVANVNKGFEAVFVVSPEGASRVDEARVGFNTSDVTRTVTVRVNGRDYEANVTVHSVSNTDAVVNIAVPALQLSFTGKFNVGVQRPVGSGLTGAVRVVNNFADTACSVDEVTATLVDKSGGSETLPFTEQKPDGTPRSVTLGNGTVVTILDAVVQGESGGNGSGAVKVRVDVPDEQVPATEQWVLAGEGLEPVPTVNGDTSNFGIVDTHAKVLRTPEGATTGTADGGM